MANETTERFWAKVDIRDPDDCWNWKAAKTSEGYGSFWYGDKTVGTHRLAYQLARGPIPERGHVLHHCDNPPCVNPGHLYIGTPNDNMLDAYARGQKIPTRNELNGNSKLTMEKAREIRSLSHALTQDHLARMFGVHQSTISLVINNKRWTETT